METAIWKVSFYGEDVVDRGGVSMDNRSRWCFCVFSTIPLLK